MKDDPRTHPFRDSIQDAEAVRSLPDTPQTRAPAYRLAFTDAEFLMRADLRPVRLQLELLKPELVIDERGIASTVVLFGGARIPDPERPRGGPADALAGWYGEARRFAAAITERSMQSYGRDWVICTGGGPGIMEAGNRGAHEAGGQSIGLNIVLPHEQAPNGYVTPDLCFNFHYFAIRKMHFLMRARVIAVFPGGFGTLDELFETLTLIQSGRMRRIPVVLFGRAYWERVVNWQALCEAGAISPGDLELFRFVETAPEALAAIDAWPDPGC
jgi:uncharacterized protein (TIGR00730 family)